ncbi:MAG: 3'-5' exonuclease, partial [Paucibacter sp.]|nr:3'-5' exonuclease [Roseateles sp.]
MATVLNQCFLLIISRPYPALRTNMKGNMMVLDCETGGLSIDEHPITQFAAVIIDENFTEINRFSTFVKPYHGLTVTKAALDATMVSLAQINKGMSISDFLDALEKFCKQATTGGGKYIYLPTICGHNVSFDIAMMKRAFELEGRDMTKCFDNNNGEFVRKDTLE